VCGSPARRARWQRGVTTASSWAPCSSAVARRRQPRMDGGGVAALQVGTGESAPVRRGQPGTCAGVASPDPLVSGILPPLPLPLLKS
jgi:hypothetical protein